MTIVLIGLFLVALAVGIVIAVRKGAAGANARIEAALAGVDVQRREKANFYGLESKGASQVRGLGSLVLTPEELVFFQMVPATEVRVLRSAITGAELADGFLGKSQGRELLVVSWTSAEGEERAAWDVPGAGEWRAALA